MRYLSLAFFLTLILGFAGCGDTADTGGDADAGNGAMEEMAMEEAPAEEPAAADAMDEGSGDTPAWQVLQQNVVHSE